MTPEPPEPSDGTGKSPRYRFLPHGIAEDAAEMNLWQGAEDLELSAGGLDPADMGERPLKRSIPPVREPQVAKAHRVENEVVRESAKAVEALENQRNQAAGSPGHGVLSSGPGVAPDEEDELWEDVDGLSEILGHVPADAPGSQAPQFGEPDIKTTVRVEDMDDPDGLSAPKTRRASDVAKLRPSFKFSMVEWIGMVLLVVLIAGVGATFFFISLSHLGSVKQNAEVTDFPIKGQGFTVKSVRTYWRTPRMEGLKPDAFRRGTVLLPEIEMDVVGGPAEIRVFFRDEEGKTVGDVISRRVKGDGTMRVAATAGFEDTGMHAAYRTGQTKPWTIEVREEASDGGDGSGSAKLFETNISTDRK